MICEIRCIDGFANLYLAIAGIFAAGLDGLESSVQLTHNDCPYNPAAMSLADRQSYGITEQLPTNIAAALNAFAANDKLRSRLGKEFTEHYIAMNKDEQTKLDRMGKDERHRWLIDQY